MEPNNNPVPPVNPAPTPAPAAAPVAKAETHMLMGILAYLGILVIIPWLTSKDDPFVHGHVKQGAGLLIVHIALWLLMGASMSLGGLLQIVQLAVVVLSIIGIVNVAQKKDKVLPLVGDLFAKLPL